MAIANIVGNLISGLFWLYLANLLGAESYGEVSYFIGIGSIASSISLVGGTKNIEKPKQPEKPKFHIS